MTKIKIKMGTIPTQDRSNMLKHARKRALEAKSRAAWGVEAWLSDLLVVSLA
jgi:hypothetical protein